MCFALCSWVLSVKWMWLIMYTGSQKDWGSHYSSLFCHVLQCIVRLMCWRVGAGIAQITKLLLWSTLCPPLLKIFRQTNRHQIITTCFFQHNPKRLFPDIIGILTCYMCLVKESRLFRAVSDVFSWFYNGHSSWANCLKTCPNWLWLNIICLGKNHVYTVQTGLAKCQIL